MAEHLGVDPIGLSSIAESFETWEHANVQAALDAYLAQPGHGAQLVGVLGGQKRGFGVGLSDLLVTRALSAAGMPSTGAGSGLVDYVNQAAGPGRTLAGIQFGVALVHGSHGALAVLVRASDERSGPMGAKVTVEVVAPEPEKARAFLGRLRKLRLGDIDGIVARTEGVSPAFIKELLRKASLVAAGETADGQLVVTDGHVNAALDELMGETSTLTRILLGGATDRPPPTTRASMGWLPGTQENGQFDRGQFPCPPTP